VGKSIPLVHAGQLAKNLANSYNAFQPFAPSLRVLSAHGSVVQFGVTHTTGGYAGSFCTGVGKLPCCACVMVEANNVASRTNAKVKYGVMGMTRSRVSQPPAPDFRTAVGDVGM
jgi:hypothetical protein